MEEGLQSHLEEWKKVGATPWVLGVIQHGLQLRWKNGKPPPLQMRVPRNRQMTRELEIVMEEQVAKGLWRPVKPEDKVKWVSQAFAVPKGQQEGYHLLVDHSQLSQHLLAPHFKMSKINDVITLLEPGAYLAKIDLTNAYGQVPLSNQAAAYLVAKAGDKLWWPLGMPQGTSCAPFVFTCVIKTVWRELRRQGIQMVGYLDDCIIVMPRMTYQEAQQQLTMAIRTFTKLGFKINAQKTSAEPTKVVTFLGTEINTTTWEIKWPMAKRRAVQKSIQKLLNGAQTARSLARVVGALKAAGPAWPTVHLETFLLQKEVSQMARQGWDTKMSLSDQTYRELRRIHRLLNHEIITPITRGRVQATLTTDAAPSHGWGATLQIGDKVWKYSEQWTENQRGRHSTEMEMKAVACAMMHFQPLIRDTKLLVQSDCTAVVWDLTRKRVRSERLRATVMQILDMTVKLNISLTSSHLAGVLNVVSDKLSRTEAHSGLVLRAEVFARIQDQLGPCTIDAFATQTNAKLPRYISWQPDPEAEAQDFFAQHLNKKELYYIFPPIALLLQALAKVRNEQARAVIVAPCFPDQVWAPLLRSGTLKSINLGTDALVPNRASSELPRNTQWKACLWGMQEH